MRSVEEAIAQVGAPGQPFEVWPRPGEGGATRAFKNAPATVRELFDMARDLDGTFLVFEDEEWSFRKVMAEADALGHALVHHYGVVPGDRVGIAMRNYPEWVVSFAAILSVGAVSVSLNAWWTESEIEYAVTDSGLTVLIVDGERVERCRRPCASSGARLLAVRPAEGAVPDGVELWRDVVVPGAAMPDVSLDEESLATILYTSGTTGRPKGAVSTHGAISQAVMAFAASAAVTAARREGVEAGSGQQPCFILIVPLFHVTGCIPVMMSCFTWHYKLVMMYRWEPERALQLIERHRVTNFVGVPTQAWDLIESPNFSSYDTSSLSAVGGGGAPAPATLVARVDRAFTRGRPSLGYGMTETNAYGPGNFGDDYVANPTSTGRVPTIVMDVDIRDEELHSLPKGERGEIWLRSPTLIRGYWNRPDATAEAIVAGWLRTGDLGHVSAENLLFVEDRVKDMILRAGENVYCAEVEALLLEHPLVRDAAVVGVPDPNYGEEVGAILQVRPEHLAERTADEIVASLEGRLARFKIPSVVRLTDEELPRTATGKVLKRELRTRYFASGARG